MKKVVALIAHDEKKKELANFSQKHSSILQNFPLIATGTTGGLIQRVTGLKIKCMSSGPLGGDQQIGSLISQDSVLAVFFFRDPLNAHPHDVDISALMRICDVYSTPLATNTGSATAVVQWLKSQYSQPHIKLVKTQTAIKEESQIVQWARKIIKTPIYQNN